MISKTSLLSGLILAAAMLLPVNANATVITVTTPPGVFTNPGPVNSGDPFVFDQWFRTNTRNGGCVGITGDHPDSGGGNGSASFCVPNGSAKSDFEYYFSQPFALTTVTALQYDWFRESSSTAAAHLHQVLRLFVDADGSLATTGDRGYLVYERAYNPSVAAVPVDVWVFEDIFGANFWSTGGLPDPFAVYDRNFADWLALNPNMLVLGMSTGPGSGWDLYEGAVDLITLGRNGDNTTWNFELAQSTEVPEPATLLLLGIGVLGVGFVRRRQLRTS